MRFATVGQILAMILVWAGVLYGIDYTKNPHLWSTRVDPAFPEEGVHLRLWINHLCCTGCLDDVVTALKKVPALGRPQPQPGILPESKANERSEGLTEYGGYVDVPIKDITRLDFVMLDRVLRDVGMVPRRMEIGGIEHFRLVAEVPHMCCGMCKAGVEEGMVRARGQAIRGAFTWLDSVTVSKERKTIVAFARFLERGKTVDIGELLSELDFIGFAPSSVKVEIGDQRPSRSN